MAQWHMNAIIVITMYLSDPGVSLTGFESGLLLADHTLPGDYLCKIMVFNNATFRG